jgi:oxygen-dependent protoporphyrinogen oxidase
MNKTSKIAVIGGGVSGIATAFYLAQSGQYVDIYEANPVLGGRISCRKLGDRWVDMGGKNIGQNYDYFRKFLKQIDAAKFEYFGLNSGQKIGNSVVTLNKDKNAVYNALQLARRMGFKGLYFLLRSAYCIYKNRSQGFLNTPFFNTLSERFDNNSLTHYFSSKTIHSLIRPLTVRMNGAEPDECYLGNLGSNINLLMDNYEQLKEGMYPWLKRFPEFSPYINVHTEHTVQSIQHTNGKVLLNISGRSFEYDQIIIALPAQQAAKLLEVSVPKIAALLKGIQYYPVATIVAEYANSIFTSQTRALVFPPTSPLSNAGAYGIHELNLVRYTFSGRGARKILDSGVSSEQLIDLAERELLNHHFPIKNNLRKAYVCEYIEQGLCAYSAFHHRRLREIELALPSNVFLTGDYWRGASIEACFRAAYQVVQKINNVKINNVNAFN